MGFDQPFHASIARLSAGISPLAVSQAWIDWAQHFLISPDKQLDLAREAAREWSRLTNYCARACLDPRCPACIEPLPQDKRFVDEAWQRQPFNIVYQSFLFVQQWWHDATTNVFGVSKHHEDVVSFIARQMLDVVSPANFLLTNPLLLERTFQQSGLNFINGARNWWEDMQRAIMGNPPVGTEAFQVGTTIAVTPGKVIFRNRLMEVIQYAPSTVEVYSEPILIVPAWIMKYYILDLSPENSVIRYLVMQGYTVFVISWKNPTEAERNLRLEDYRRLGIMAALDEIGKIIPEQKVHAVGYCLGGTLLAIAASAMAREKEDRLRSITLFAAQTDFTEAGELMLFIDEDQVHFLEDMMADQGYLDARQMAGAFQLLRSNDLIWSTMVQDYLLGERRPMIDLMAWNADSTRMPAKMHSEYLHSLFLDNDLAEGRYVAGDKPVSLRDIHVPVFAVSTISDHVAPWRSVYKIQMLTDADVTFVLSNGGHNAGIVNPPGKAHSHHQIATHKEEETYVDPDAWQTSAAKHDGSWWPCWLNWLNTHSGEKSSPPAMGGGRNAPLCEAPGTYVLER